MIPSVSFRNVIDIYTYIHELFIPVSRYGNNDISIYRACVEATFGVHIMRVMVMVLHATFNTISVISWGSVLVLKTRVSRENHQPAASNLLLLLFIVLSSTPCHERDSNSQR